MSIAEDEAERVYPTRYWDGTHVKEKFYCEAAKRHRLTLRWRPWQNACYGEAGGRGMASKATMWRRTKTMRGITPGKSVAIGKTSSIGRRKYSKWNDMR